MELEWTEEIVQTLLKSPEDVLDDPAWAAFVQQIGGIDQFYAYVRALPLKEKEQAILNMLITYPGASIDTYTSLLHIHRATFYRHQQALFESLRMLIPTQLAVWIPQQSPPKLFHVPHPLTSLIGRSHETSLIADLLEAQRSRLITLTGPGGIGKTRLAIQVAHDLASSYRDGVVWINLSHIKQSEDMPYAVVKALNISLDPNIPIRDTIIAACAQQHALLIFDNMEHLLDASPLLTDMLQAAPDIAIIATSRVRLRLYGESIVRLEALSLPPDNTLELLLDYDAIRLLVERLESQQLGQQLTPQEYTSLYAIATVLEGIPLALELAAASYPEYSLQDINTGLEQALAFLVNGPRNVDQRQQTLEATIAWSYQLLTPMTQHVFDHLGLFVGPWTTEALASVVEYPVDQALRELKDYHLIMYHPETDDWSMLETIRAYAVHRMHQYSVDAVESWHARQLQFYVIWLEPTEQLLMGPQQIEWTNILDRAYPNIKVVLDFGIINPKFITGILKIAAALWRYWINQGLEQEGKYYLQTILDTVPDTIDLQAQACAYHGLGAMYHTTFMDSQETLAILEKALSIAQNIQDRWRVASVINAIGLLYINRSSFDDNVNKAISFLQQSLEIRREIGDKNEIAGSLLNIGNVFYRIDDYEQAVTYYEEARLIFEETQDLAGLCFAIHNLAVMFMFQKKYRKAEYYLNMNYPLRLELGNVSGIVSVLDKFVHIYIVLEDYPKALDYLSKINRLLPELKDYIVIYAILELAVEICLLISKYELSIQFYGFLQYIESSYHLNNSQGVRKKIGLFEEQLKLVFDNEIYQKLLKTGSQWSNEGFFEAFATMKQAFEEFVRAQI